MSKNDSLKPVMFEMALHLTYENAIIQLLRPNLAGNYFLLSFPFFLDFLSDLGHFVWVSDLKLTKYDQNVQMEPRPFGQFVELQYKTASQTKYGI